jgi:hypothetical protein
MQQFFNLFIDFVLQGVDAIFRFVQAIWMWAVAQVSKLIQQPFQDWQPWKLLILTLIAVGVFWYLYKAMWELWDAGQKILAALGTLMAVLIKTVPQVLIAGLIALAGVFLLSVLDLDNMRRPSFMSGAGSERVDRGDYSEPADRWGWDRADRRNRGARCDREGCER